MTGRNQLLYYHTLKRGTLELSKAAPVAVDALIDGSSVRLSNLFAPTDEDPERFAAALKRASTVYRKAVDHYEERGIQTGFEGRGSRIVAALTRAIRDSLRRT